MSTPEELIRELSATQACVNVLIEAELSPDAYRRIAQHLLDAFAAEAERANGQSSSIRLLVQSDDFRALNTAKDQYLAILRFLVEAADPDRLAQAALALRTGTRKPLAPSEEEVNRSGRTAKAAQVCEGWWADTNNNTGQKRINTRRLMTNLGYSRSEISLAMESIR